MSTHNTSKTFSVCVCVCVCLSVCLRTHTYTREHTHTLILFTVQREPVGPYCYISHSPDRIKASLFTVDGQYLTPFVLSFIYKRFFGSYSPPYSSSSRHVSASQVHLNTALDQPV